ncbi:mannose-1-phosphate guanyltransferase alpha-A isoform X1 [Octopus bimaculoides]|uniref:mannose-1-phosphate guanyltransferase alpha-A isoform X1 n=1 Tax=Octopus bimaculoides TaxID=37653 RepID=UPI00071D2C14|nr:mannose-1-phosphate guanyltransferase alpha-A isoform X1 [Octopus bimaculoides]|eukprot:XP_014772370.1 PREDICTED: mannose-1-phosphate guanyltransferase alpha-A-like isoform X2 [Octopus bimaculoides]
MIKAVILIGGPMKGTRFRPLSLDLPKPLFPVAGFPMIYHHIAACAKVPNLQEILLIGFYRHLEPLKKFIAECQQEFKVQIRYLLEYTALGTAGGLFLFRDQILIDNPKAFFVMNADVCGDFPLLEMLNFHKQNPAGSYGTILGTEATRQQSLRFGSMVEGKATHEVLHYVEKPETFVSNIINCGIYLFNPEIFQAIETAFKKNAKDSYNRIPLDMEFGLDDPVQSREMIRLEQDVFVPLAGSGKLYICHTNKFWSQIKSAGAAVYANRHYLAIYNKTHPERLAVNTEDSPKIIGDVYIHPTAQVDPTCVVGPNVTIGKNVKVKAGVRLRESIILEDAVLQDHSCILYSIVGWNSIVGAWSRVEGTPNDPNPNKPFAKLDIPALFTDDGRLNPSITVIGSKVHIPPEVIILNSIVLPDKDLNSSYKNQIIL